MASLSYIVTQHGVSFITKDYQEACACRRDGAMVERVYGEVVTGAAFDPAHKRKLDAIFAVGKKA